MKKTLLTLAALGVALIGGQALTAGLGVMPQETTVRLMTDHAPIIVKARVIQVKDTPIPEGTHNYDVTYYAYNNSNKTIRRDLVLEVTEVLQGDIALGTLTIPSLQQRALSQYPASLRQEKEGIFCIHENVIANNADDPINGEPVKRLEIFGEARGMIAEEDMGGDLTAAEDAIEDIIAIKATQDASQRRLAMQDRLMEALSPTANRVSTDALLELGWHSEEYLTAFTGEEKAQLLELLAETEAGSMQRIAALHALGRIKPAGAESQIVETIVNDASERVAIMASWALEQYDRGATAGMLLDRYIEVEDGNNVAQARLITALGVMRPKAYRDNEANAHARFTDVLRGALHVNENSEVRRQALLAARDMRYTDNQLASELKAVIANAATGVTSEEDKKRAIVALAATRNLEAHQYLEGIKGQFEGRYDKHIELALQTPFTVLVNGK